MINLNEIIDAQFGKAGTATREAFDHTAFSNYFAKLRLLFFFSLLFYQFSGSLFIWIGQKI